MTEFTETCSKSYDRHDYSIRFADGREQLFGDYETMRHFWFTHSMLSNMTVHVIDKNKGFA
jgi:hypothetical protein